MKEIENDLLTSYRKITNVRFRDGGMDWDSLEIYNNIFLEKFDKYTSNCPETFTHRFDSLRKEHFQIVSSDDRKLKIYSWDTWLGGTMRDFRNIFQYRVGNSVVSHIVLDTGDISDEKYVPFYSQIFTLQAHGRTYYMTVGNGIYSTKDVSQSITIFIIDHGSLKTADIIKTKNDLTNSIEFYYDFFSAAAQHDERPLKLIRYNTKTSILYIPVVDTNGKITKNFLAYKFKGNYFEYVGIKKG